MIVLLNHLQILELIGNEVHFSTEEEEKEKVSKFIQQVCYNSYKNETMIDTKIWLYKRMKTLRSFSLPPDPNSLRVHHQVYYRIRFNHRIVTELDPTKYGWNVDRDKIWLPQYGMKGLTTRINDNAKAERHNPHW